MDEWHKDNEEMIIHHNLFEYDAIDNDETPIINLLKVILLSLVLIITQNILVFYYEQINSTLYKNLNRSSTLNMDSVRHGEDRG